MSVVVCSGRRTALWEYKGLSLRRTKHGSLYDRTKSKCEV